jgi:hypothetical protein
MANHLKLHPHIAVSQNAIIVTDRTDDPGRRETQRCKCLVSTTCPLSLFHL